MYGRENFKKIKAQIEERRRAAIAESEARCEDVRRQSARVREIDEELSRTGLAIFRAAIAGEDIAPIKERNLALTSERNAQIKKLGYPDGYTEIHYTCPICSDTGFNDTNMCSCMKELLVLENIKSSGIGRLIEKQSFDNLDLSWYADDQKNYERMKSNIEAARRFAADFHVPTSANLLLIGKTGTGKTHVSTAIAKVVIEKGYEVLYDSAQNIVSAFENDRFKSGYGPYEPQGDKYLECDLLILDDLGTEFVNQFTVSCLYNLLNTRMNKGLATVISTNLTPEELSAKYEDRIYSRIVGSDSRILLFAGRDYRINR